MLASPKQFVALEHGINKTQCVVNTKDLVGVARVLMFAIWGITRENPKLSLT